ncbi:hypothetical protein [Rhodococcus artemisiae]|uniref:Uncharacterized protein n=1 Tax=Rhodococcus artemisiae TaxID=714159 RepID=A0ABU7L8E8_9NOCA|nr:hypothetical protein [Rhodococcus artemisiae]MEE2057816.1 hypothetical protein [Rhodococcus artemisiae]
MSGYQVHAYATHPAPAPFAASPAPEFVVDRRPWWRRHPILTTLGVLWLVGFAQEEPAVAAVMLAVLLAAVAAGSRRRSRDERRREEAAIVARADAQHQAYLDGDPRGIYGFPTEPATLPQPIPYYRPAAQQPWIAPNAQQPRAQHHQYAQHMQQWHTHTHHGHYRRYHC